MRSQLLLGLLAATAIVACGGGHESHDADDAHLLIETSPSPVVAGQQTTLTARLLGPDDTPATGIEIEHERYLHVGVVSGDLASFGHIHPEDVGPVIAEDLAAATFTLEHTFPTAGSHILGATWCRDGAPGSDFVVVAATGDPAQGTIDDAPRTTWTGEGYEAVLGPRAGADATPRADAAWPFEIAITQGGIDVNDLGMYLGAEMHVIAVHEGLDEYLHAHPASEGGGEHTHCAGPRDQEHFGPAIPFESTFPAPGIWKLWAQWNHGGAIHTADFVIDVR